MTHNNRFTCHRWVGHRGKAAKSIAQGKFGQPKRQRGVALLIILSIVVLALTTVVVASLSINSLRTERDQTSNLVLNQARESLLGYALRHNVTGSLPCPDTDDPADGQENRSGSACANQIGWFPYRTMSTEEFVDGSGTLLWYAVSPSYSNSSGLAARNSSISNNYTLDGNEVAAVIIAPGIALDGQQRVPVTVAGFLEDENANASVDTYARSPSDTNNDKLIGLGVADFWSLMERKVLIEIESLARDYKLACSEFPWAANFNVGADDSVDTLQSGSFPFDSALPTDWGSGCAASIGPSVEIQFNWRDQIYYSFCTVAENDCINIVGDNPTTATAVLIAPGIPLASQNRSVAAQADYFETENATAGEPYRQLLPRNLDSNFNDVLKVVSP